MFNFKLLGLIGAALAVAATIAAVLLHFKEDAKLREDYATLSAQADNVLKATRTAANNPELEWAQTAGQIVALGESNNKLRVSLELQNERIDEMAAEAIRLRAQANELREIAEKAKVQRAAALKELSDLAASPGTRANCMALLEEAERALDIVREAGL